MMRRWWERWLVRRLNASYAKYRDAYEPLDIADIFKATPADVPFLSMLGDNAEDFRKV